MYGNPDKFIPNPEPELQSDFTWEQLIEAARAAKTTFGDDPGSKSHDEGLAKAWGLLLDELRILPPPNPNWKIGPGNIEFQLLDTLDVRLRRCMTTAKDSEKALKLGIQELAKNLKSGIIM